MRVAALGLACVAASAQNAGHDVRILDLISEKSPEKAVSQTVGDFQPDAIGVSVRNIDDQNMAAPRFLLDQAREAAAWCRTCSKAPIILGGAGFSVLPQAILNYMDADVGVQGEGEAVFPELLRRLESGARPDELPGVCCKNKKFSGKRSFIKDLNALPLPDPSFLIRSLAGANDAPVPLQTRRGCPLSCSYCSTPIIEGKTVRWRDQDKVVSWIARWVAEGFRRFYFVDNTFNLPPSYAMSLCSKIIAEKLDISWRCILYPAALEERLIEKMAKAGCREASIGFESGAATILHGMRKRYSPGEVRRACGLLRRYGIRSMGFLLLGGPDETEETVKQSLEFAEDLDMDALKISIGVRIYPETELARRAKEEALISTDADLLFPRFYLAPGLENWIYDAAERSLALHRNWTL